MRALLVFALMSAVMPAHAEMSAEEAIQEWRAANWTCESGQNHDGDKVGLQELKEACVNLGIMTAKLSQAGYCYDDKTVEWAVCQ